MHLGHNSVYVYITIGQGFCEGMPVPAGPQHWGILVTLSLKTTCITGAFIVYYNVFIILSDALYH